MPRSELTWKVASIHGTAGNGALAPAAEVTAPRHKASLVTQRTFEMGCWKLL